MRAEGTVGGSQSNVTGLSVGVTEKLGAIVLGRTVHSRSAVST